jgi:hypothetical protein
MATPPGTVRSASQELPRSDFVTVLGCFAIAAAVLAVLLSMVTASILFAGSESRRWSALGPSPDNHMGFSVLQPLVAHPELLLYASWMLSVATLVAGIELLRRRNWARLYMIAMLALGMLWQVLAVWIEGRMIAFVGTVPGRTAESFGSMATSWSLILASSAPWCLLLTWLIWKLRSKRIAAEFGAA